MQLKHCLRLWNEIHIWFQIGYVGSITFKKPICKVTHPSFFNKKFLFSSTSTNSTLDPLPRVSVCTLFYMCWLDKRGHYMWWYFTCKHVALFKNPLYYMYFDCRIYLQFFIPRGIYDCCSDPPSYICKISYSFLWSGRTGS